jgi:YVTN family beta-propeller protein
MRHSLLAAALILGACSEDVAQIEPYKGEPAYPNLRNGFDTAGRTIGYVANRMSDSVSVIDLDSMTRLGEAPVGRDPVDVDGPRHIVIDRERGIGYVALSYPLSVVSAHVETNNALARAGYVQSLALSDLAPLGELRVEPSATEVALSSDGTSLVVSHHDIARSLLMSELEARRATLEFIDSPFALGEPAATVRKLKVCVSPSAVLYEAERSRAFVTCTGEDTLAAIDTDALKVLSFVPAGESQANQPTSLVRAPEGGRMVLSNRIAGSIVVFDMEDTPTPLVSLYLNQGAPYTAGWLAGNRLAVPTQSPNAAVLIDLDAKAIVKEAEFTADVCTNPSEAQATSDGRLFVLCEGTHFTPGTLVQLDPETLDVLARVEVGEWPDRMTVIEP